VTAVHKHIVVIDGDGVTLATYGPTLVIRSRTMPLTSLPKNTHTIIMDGFGGSITTAAINALASKYVEVLVAARSHGTMALFAPHPHVNSNRAALRLRERQFRAAFDQKKTVEIAQAIVCKKIKAEKHERVVEQEILTALQRTKTTDDVRHVEAGSAQLWWSQWTGTKIRFAGAAVPAEWRSFQTRYIGRRQGWLGELPAQFTARGAVHPMQAMLNYAVGVLAARMTRVVIARGLDASFGFLHDGRKPGRLSLVWDAVEPLRPKVVTAVFELAEQKVFTRRSFGDFSKETIGLMPPLSREVAEVSVRVTPLREMVRVVDWLARII
jgi:CRISP-associated protein Cas1